MSKNNLLKMFDKADKVDMAEGQLAYERYHSVMKMFSEEYETEIEKVIAVFCALSPNNDYFGNLRSMASVLKGFNDGVPVTEITVSTYKHCRDRSFKYLTEENVFTEMVKGPKITSFYHNLLTPTSGAWVTIDGHMKAAYVDQPLTMKEAIIRTKGEYRLIAEVTTEIANDKGMLPNQVQAVIWFSRKRNLGVKYDPQMSLWGDPTDLWRTIIKPSEALPYERKEDG